jgi:hypothetical protein
LLSLTSGNVTFIDDALWAFAYDLASRSPWVRVTALLVAVHNFTCAQAQALSGNLSPAVVAVAREYEWGTPI